MAHTRKVAATAGFLLLFGAVISAQLVRPLAPSGVPHTAASGVIGSGRSGQGMIHGTALDHNSSPLPNATVRLRNLTTGEIEKVSSANAVGEFTFIAEPDMPYVVEIADQAGQIIAVGNVVTAQVGEVAGSIVSVPVRLPPMTGGWLGDTASSVASAATGTGVSAFGTTLPPPASPEG